MATERKPAPALPPDVAARVARMPDWLKDSAAEAFVAVDEVGARNAVKEREETDRTAARVRLANAAAEALRGDWGKETQASVTRVLNGVTPLKAEVAVLVMCEAIVKEEQKRRREKRRVQKHARGAK